MKADPNNHHKANFSMDSPTIIINMSDPHHHHDRHYYSYRTSTTTLPTTTTTERIFECTTPIQVSGNNNDVRITSTVTTTADGDTVAVVTCTVRDVMANNQNNQPNQAWMNENGFGWFTTPNGDQTMVRTYKCNHETGSWYIGDTPTDAVRFVRCADREI